MPEMLSDPYFEVCHNRFDWLRNKRNGWQFGEQGLIDAIVEKILQSVGSVTGSFVEIGAGDGNALPLTLERFVDRGVDVHAYEMNEESQKSLSEKFPTITVHGEYKRWQQIEDVAVVVIDIDGADSLVMKSVLMRTRPVLLVVEHYDKAGPYVTEGCYSLSEQVPEWLLGMPLGIPEGQFFIIQSPAEHLDQIALNKSMVPVCKTRVNSFYVQASLAKELYSV